MQDFILDIGSRTIKLHGLDSMTGEVINLRNITWDILSVVPSEQLVDSYIEASLEPLRGRPSRLRAIGTEAMRKNPSLERMVANACARLDVDYATISQEIEAKLISIAARQHGISEEYDVVNSGGGSLQIISQKENAIDLLGVGIADINRRFNLTAAPQFREIESCITWLKAQIPLGARAIAYTGGERKYLESFNVSIEPDGRCLYEVFERFAREIGQQTNEWLTQRSPFDSQWMTGAVASNCIVLAFMNCRKVGYFLPSNLNIGHGVLSSIYHGLGQL